VTEAEEEAYYYGLRTIARKRALDDLNSRIMRDGGAAIWQGTKLASITPDAIDYAEQIWPKYYGSHTHNGFSKQWSSIWYHAQLQPARFDMAVWQEVGDDRILQGLAVGRASSGREHLTLNWVERNFGPEYTRFGILVPVLLCFEHYAHLLGCQRTLIKNPVDPSVYERYGYAAVKLQGSDSTAVHLAKELNDG
jgi:hypothetical protein